MCRPESSILHVVIVLTSQQLIAFSMCSCDGGGVVLRSLFQRERTVERAAVI